MFEKEKAELYLCDGKVEGCTKESCYVHHYTDPDGYYPCMYTANAGNALFKQNNSSLAREAAKASTK